MNKQDKPRVDIRDHIVQDQHAIGDRVQNQDGTWGTIAVDGVHWDDDAAR